MGYFSWDRIALDAAVTACVFVTLLVLFGLRRRLGVIPFAFVLGALGQAAVWSREISGAAGPGIDGALLTTTLVVIVLAYLREDVSAVRQIVVGTLVASIAIAVLAWLGRLRAELADARAFPSTAGAVLFLRLLAPILSQIFSVVAYETLGAIRAGPPILRVGLAALVSAVAAVAVLAVTHHYGAPELGSVLGEAIASCTIAAVLSMALLVVVVRQFGGLELDRPETDRATRMSRVVKLLSWREKYEIAREQAVRDALTGLRNRGYFDEALEREVAVANRYRRPVTLLMIDIDRFKRINDRFGHRTGDDVLRAVGEAIESELRAADLACRYGGEEIAVILPETDGLAAAMLARRLHGSIAAAGGDGLPTFTATIGVATYPLEAESAADLVSLADRRLYEGKRGGRNCIVATGGITGEAEL